MSLIKKAYLFAALAVFFWSTVATAFKLALRELDFIQLIFYTSLVSTFILFFILAVSKNLKLLSQQTKKNIVSSMILGALNPFAYYLILFKAYSLLPAQLAQPLNMVWPITLALLSVPLLNQKIGWISLVSLLVSFIGVIFISSQGGFAGFKNTSVFGVCLAVGSSVIWAFYWILNVKDKRDNLVKLFLNFCFGTIYLIITVFLFSDFTLPQKQGIFSVIYIGLFETGLTYILWLKAMEYSTNNARIGNLVFIAPFVSLIFIHFILKETIFVTTFIGLVFIVAGIFVQQLDKRKEIKGA